MTENAKTTRTLREYDWPSLEIEFLRNPSITIQDFAELHDINTGALRDHSGPGAGCWIAKRASRFQAICDADRARMADILHETSRDDVSVFRSLESRLQFVVLSSLELLFPPEDAPLEALIAARNRLESLSATQLSRVINEGLRTLTETGRHRRLLTGQATAIFARAEAPDVLIPVPIDDARTLEMRSRMAQTAMKAVEAGAPLDIDFAVMESPEVAGESARSIPPDFADL